MTVYLVMPHDELFFPSFSSSTTMLFGWGNLALKVLHCFVSFLSEVLLVPYIPLVFSHLF